MEERSIFSDRKYLESLYSDDKRPPSTYPKKLANYLSKKYIPKKNAKLLDLGCGRGDMLKAFSELGYEGLGLDLSPISQESCAPIEVRLANLEEDSFPFREGEFDYIFSKSVIEHLREPMHCINESYRILKQEGKAIFMTPSWKHNSWGPFYLDHTHVTAFTRFSLKNCMEMAGFRDVSVIYFYQLPFLWEASCLHFIPRIIAASKISYWPMEDLKWPQAVNKLIRFSNEVMLVAIGKK